MCKQNLLDEVKADAICTLITFGFFSKEFKKIKVEYETAEDKNKYQLVSALFHKCKGNSIVVQQSSPQQEMPHIVAQTKNTYNPSIAKANSDDNWKYIHSLQRAASGTNAPRGAYIGGLSQIGSMIIVGPSGLELYDPRYRTANVKSIQTAYNNAKTSTNASIDIINNSNTSLAKDKITFDQDTLKEITENYKQGKLFKSYHGMIQVLAKYCPNTDKNDYAFELALGANTTKVSSCIPCSIFMTVIGHPPTSIHLGRGDNWNIPRNTLSQYTTQWRDKVLEYYKEGLTLVKSDTPKINNFTSAFTQHKCSDSEIPDIFLEALTFEKSFTDRIINTFSETTK